MAVGAVWLAQGDRWWRHASGAASARKGWVHQDAVESRGVMGMQMQMRAPEMHRICLTMKERPQFVLHAWRDGSETAFGT